MKILSQSEQWPERVGAVNWQAPVTVMGRKFVFNQMNGKTFYNGSPHDIPEGTVLVPGQQANYKQSDPSVVSITSSPEVARHWAGKGGYVYEVEPRGDIDPWRVAMANYGQNFDLLEGRVPTARIVRKLS